MIPIQVRRPLSQLRKIRVYFRGTGNYRDYLALSLEQARKAFFIEEYPQYTICGGSMVDIQMYKRVKPYMRAEYSK